MRRRGTIEKKIRKIRSTLYNVYVVYNIVFVPVLHLTVTGHLIKINYLILKIGISPMIKMAYVFCMQI